MSFHRRNQPCQILSQSDQGFWFCGGSNFWLSHKKEKSPLTQGLNYRSACDDATTVHMLVMGSSGVTTTGGCCSYVMSASSQPNRIVYHCLLLLHCVTTTGGCCSYVMSASSLLITLSIIASYYYTALLLQVGVVVTW